MSESEEFEFDPTLNSIIENKSLNWIFVGGKGGVGKTTTSCAIAALMSKFRKKVLLISTDPAHNISDTLKQKIGDYETKVNGYDNLYAMEISAKKGISEYLESDQKGLMTSLISSIPGIDEAISFAELMKQIKETTYDLIIFDTAPTGHTLKFLGFPEILEKGIEKLIELRSKFSGLINHVGNLINGGNDANGAKKIDQNSLLAKLEATKIVIEAVNSQFKNKNLTVFIAVCIPEFLSVFETERLLEALDGFGICCAALVVNMVLFPEKDSNCKKCLARVKMQRKYLLQINSMFDSMSIVTVPLGDEEIRGKELINSYSKHLITPFCPS